MGATGKAKTGGRKKGTPNKRTQEFIEVLERRKFSPADALIDVYRKALKAFNSGAGKSFGDGPDMNFKYLEIANKAACDLMQYRFPKRKALEIDDARNNEAPKVLVLWADEDGNAEATAQAANSTPKAD